MAGKPVKHRAGTRIWLDTALKEMNFDALKEFKKLYLNAEKPEQQIKLLEMAWDRLYPKARPEDGDGNPGEVGVIAPVIVTPEQMKELVAVARGNKTEGQKQ